MDYKEEYQKALERAKKGLPIDEVFLELKESEDERIRKCIRLCLDECVHSDIIRDYERDECLAYLEKQKEQKPADVSEKIEELCSKYPLNKCGVSEQELSAYHQGLTFGATRIAEYLGAQHPAEWSKEDSRILYNVITYVGYAAGQIGVRNDLFKEANDWLKSLPERINLPPKQEWSEGDINRHYYLCKLLRETWDKVDKGSCIDDAITWLEKLPEQIYPHSWKPSKEQMDHLAYAYTQLKLQKCYALHVYESLGSLYDDLKKLI